MLSLAAKVTITMTGYTTLPLPASTFYFQNPADYIFR